MRENYIAFLKSDSATQLGIEFKPYTYQILMPPVTKKMIDKISEPEEPTIKNNRVLNKLKTGL